jgi:alpha-galactosidase
MQGVLGVGGDISRWSEAELEMARRLIEQYKEIRPLVQHGRQYWLLRPAAIGPIACQFVSESGEETVVFLYQLRGLVSAGVRRARLQGLLPSRRYRRVTDGVESTGAALMAAGIPLDFVSAASGPRGLDWRSRLEVWRAI